MWRSSLIQSLASSFLMLVLMLDAGFDYDSKNFKSPFHKAQNSGRTIMSRSTSMSTRGKAEHRTANIEHRGLNVPGTPYQRRKQGPLTPSLGERACGSTSPIYHLLSFKPSLGRWTCSYVRVPGA